MKSKALNHSVVTFSIPQRLAGLMVLMRPRQWVKNVFVLAPLLFTGMFAQSSAVKQALLSMLLFCMASSATYVVNDWRDIERDRRHPTKRHKRPMAAGSVTRPAAAALLVTLYALLALGALVQPKVMSVIAIYIVLNLAYSFGLKHQPVVDIFIIASGFVLRVIAGAMALSVPVSSWMFVTTLCLALYLAAVKRRQELARSGTGSREVLQKYSLGLIDRYAEMSATGALVFYSLFVMSAHTELIVTIPLVLFGIFRYWYVVEQKGGGESPTDALLTDWQLMITGMAWVVLCAWRLAGGS
ncbi:decaprenyl-phosphate phosphoribosyltransferase [Ottowia testudinis]|uniref:Decaprenyl-phosphate phosphoribosyltransferase n=1 Tax=Ottowia testudinis TaxID=2816950 RepID=A0A975CJM5_9BURK|nr:decaprenyl-phosphate phosphoribosyltransferase [Ottowia testudinis]QTD47046.1 decaprenyl-phosphate phosphoribosyltransferase [Ottowia testudinis]